MNKIDQLKQTVREAVENFSQNQMCRLADQGQFTFKAYHQLLLMIFHQTYQGPSTFALAGAHCSAAHEQARDYLIHHADEEKDHWQWVISDLKQTGYTGADPRTLFAQTATQAYVAFNFYTALKSPLARLAIAATLESIGATYGKKYATAIVNQLKLKPNQVKFFFGHGDTDVGHTQEIFEVIESLDLSKSEWNTLINAAATAGQLYKNMYDEVEA